MSSLDKITKQLATLVHAVPELAPTILSVCKMHVGLDTKKMYLENIALILRIQGDIAKTEKAIFLIEVAPQLATNGVSVEIFRDHIRRYKNHVAILEESLPIPTRHLYAAGRG